MDNVTNTVLTDLRLSCHTILFKVYEFYRHIFLYFIKKLGGALPARIATSPPPPSNRPSASSSSALFAYVTITRPPTPNTFDRKGVSCRKW